MSLQPPKQIEGYELGELLGRGGMGEVYLARHVRLDRQVALKLLVRDEPGATLPRFRQEAIALKSLVHENIVRLLDYDLECERPYLVFEYLNGARTLQELLWKRMPAGQGVHRFARGLAAGLAAVHQQGIIHRDMKPGNVLIARDDSPKIIDLGLARATDNARTRLTQDGEVLGTLAYMAPEQLRGEDVGPRADVYAFGLILYELAAGHPVFARSHVDGPVLVPYTVRLAGRISSIGTFAPATPPSLMRVIEACLALDPSDRPADARSVQEMLERAMAGRAGDTTGFARPVPPPPSDVRPPSGDRTRIARPFSAPGEEEPRARGTRALKPLLGASGALAVLMLVRGAIRPQTPPPDPLPPRLASASAVPAAEPPLRQLAHQLLVRLNGARGALDEAWLRSLASRHRTDLKKSPGTVAAAVGEHLHRLGLAAMARTFLEKAHAYFADESVPASERWAVRAALCDLELVEYFCREHRLDWPLPPVAGCAPEWDRIMDPHHLPMLSARSWVRGVKTGEERYFPGGSLTDRIELPPPAPGESALIWYSALRWRSGVILDISINGRLRRLLRHQPPSGPVAPIAIFAAEAVGGYPRVVDQPEFVVHGATNESDIRSFPGVMIPRVALERSNEIRLRMIDLPMSALAASEPAIVDRILTLLPAGSPGPDPGAGVFRAKRLDKPPDLSGAWFLDGDRTKSCRIEQAAGSDQLRFINERGDPTLGYFENRQAVVTTRWGQLRGQVALDLRLLKWSNGSRWTR